MAVLHSPLLLLLLLGLALVRGLSVNDFKGKNVVLFLTDEERSTQDFPEGWEAANMPGLTRLKKNGLSFKNYFTNSNLCSPARATLLTGYMPAQHGVRYVLRYNMPDTQYPQVEMPDEIPNLASAMKAAGYNVVYKGKAHFNKAANPNGTFVPSDIANYGFERWNPPDSGDSNGFVEFGGGTAEGANNDYRYMASEGPVEDGMEGALQWINNYAAQSQPFFLVISLVNPHDIIWYPTNLFYSSGYNDTWLEGDIDLPSTANESLLPTKPKVQQQFKVIADAVLGPLNTTEKQVNYVNFYGNLLKLADSYLVQALDALAPFLNDTVVIKTSDHGEAGLSHGLLRQKNYNFYEQSINVPLIISNPKLYPTAQETTSLASHVDFLPTLATLFKVPHAARAKWNGRDLSPIVFNPKAQVQDHVVFTYDDFQSGQNTPPYVSNPNHIIAIREKRYKIAKYFDPSAEVTKVASQWEMYDLLVDPAEKTNLAFKLYKRTAVQEKEYQRLKRKLNRVYLNRLGPLPLTRPITLILVNGTAGKKTLTFAASGTPIGKGFITFEFTINPSPIHTFPNWPHQSVPSTVGKISAKVKIVSQIGIIRGTASGSFKAAFGKLSVVNGTVTLYQGGGAFRGIKATRLPLSLDLAGESTITGSGKF